MRAFEAKQTFSEAIIIVMLLKSILKEIERRITLEKAQTIDAWAVAIYVVKEANRAIEEIRYGAFKEITHL